MSATGEDVAPAVEKPVEEVKAPKPAKEKKPKAPKEKKPKQAKTASHPPYFQMIKEALLALNEKGGSSPHAIAKYMEEKHKAVLPANFKKILGLQLKNQAARGKLMKIKASYKLSETAKKEKKESATKVTKANAEKKESRPKRSRRVTATAPKSKKGEAVKKAGPKKAKKVSTPAKPKQPKSIRSPSKRARKTTVAAA
uniref:Histone H1 n=1 Tax=Cajanus cajan TaxID=3821 RepID=A0A151TIM1_CAJCA|nr:Histone H1 [Cajanus cajan]